MANEKTCSSGFVVFPTIGTLVNSTNGKFRQWACYDSMGNVNLDLGSGTVNASNIGGGTGPGMANALLFGTTSVPIGTPAPATGQLLSFNGSDIVPFSLPAFPVTVVIKGQTPLGTGVIPANGNRSVTAAGTSGIVATATDTVIWNFTGNPAGTTGFGTGGPVTIYTTINSAGIQFVLANPSSSPITPSISLNINWMVLR